MLLQDARYAARMLRREPVFAATAVLTLALAIGATGAIFELLDAAVVRSWAFPHPEQLMLITGRDSMGNGMPVSVPDIDDYRRARSLALLAAGIVRALPLSGNIETVEIGFPDRPPAQTGTPYMSNYNAVTPTYFSAAGIPLIGGRCIQPSDTQTAPRVAVVSRIFARTYWPGTSAIGQQVLIPAHDEAVSGPGPRLIPANVVGVVGDVEQESIDEAIRPQVYVAYAQDPFIFATLVVRTKGDAMAMSQSVQRAIWSIDADQPVWKIRTMQSLVDQSIMGGSRQMLAIALASFAGLALLLASIGLYGVLAYTVGQRGAEFGIRMALGAGPRKIMALVLRRGAAVAGAGLAIGLVLSLVLNRVLSSELYQVSTNDPKVYAAIIVVIVLIGAAAITAPARRAVRIDPASAIRHE